MIRYLVCCGRYASIVSLLFLCFPSLINPVFAAEYGQVDVGSSIQLAEESVSLAFKTVKETEDAGGNVSMLIFRLNEAASLLTSAKMMMIQGYDQDAVELSTRSVEIADGVKSESLVLKDAVLSHREFVFKVALIGSVTGILVFSVLMFLLWRWFKGYYAHKILNLKPEVA